MVDVKKNKYRCKYDLYYDWMLEYIVPKRRFKKGQIVEGYPKRSFDKDYIYVEGVLIPVNYLEKL